MKPSEIAQNVRQVQMAREQLDHALMAIERVQLNRKLKTYVNPAALHNVRLMLDQAGSKLERDEHGWLQEADNVQQPADTREEVAA